MHNLKQPTRSDAPPVQQPGGTGRGPRLSRPITPPLPAAHMGDLNAGLTAGVHTTHTGPLSAGSAPMAIKTQRAGYVATDGGVSLNEMVAWDENQVAAWVATLPRLAPYAALFVEHQIEGKLFARLDEGMLREMVRCASLPSAVALPQPPPACCRPSANPCRVPLSQGISLVGPRARLLDELSRIKSQQRRARREAAIWEADQYDGERITHRLFGPASPRSPSFPPASPLAQWLLSFPAGRPELLREVHRVQQLLPKAARALQADLGLHGVRHCLRLVCSTAFRGLDSAFTLFSTGFCG